MTPAEQLDVRLLRAMLVLDGRIRRPLVVASGVVAAQLAELVLHGSVVDEVGRVFVDDTSAAVSEELAVLRAALAADPGRSWQLWFQRPSADCTQTYNEAVARLTRDGVWAGSGRAVPGRRVVVRDRDEDAVRREVERFTDPSTRPVLDARDAMLLELLAVCRAKKWSPLVPPAPADHLATVADLPARHEVALRDLVDALVDERALAAQRPSWLSELMDVLLPD